MPEIGEASLIGGIACREGEGVDRSYIVGHIHLTLPALPQSSTPPAERIQFLPLAIIRPCGGGREALARGQSD